LRKRKLTKRKKDENTFVKTPQSLGVLSNPLTGLTKTNGHHMIFERAMHIKTTASFLSSLLMKDTKFLILFLLPLLLLSSCSAQTQSASSSYTTPTHYETIEINMLTPTSALKSVRYSYSSFCGTLTTYPYDHWEGDNELYGLKASDLYQTAQKVYSNALYYITRPAYGWDHNYLIFDFEDGSSFKLLMKPKSEATSHAIGVSGCILPSGVADDPLNQEVFGFSFDEEALGTMWQLIAASASAHGTN
jgi:hypothetical protein